MEDCKRYGQLLHPSIKLHRQYFREMVKLLGINVLYRAPLPGKTYTTYAELESNYAAPIMIGCIFTEHPNQQTLRKIGWVAELQEGSSLIHVDYDLPNLQQGALFIIPSGLDNSKGRLFRVVRMENSIVYPASILCEIVPEYYDSVVPDTIYDYTDNDFNVLNDEEEQLFA